MKDELQRLLRSEAFQEGTHWTRRQFRAGEEIIRQGDVSHSIFMVVEGMVRVVGRIAIDDRRTASPNVCDLGVGEVFGELSLFDDQPRSASVVAVTDCEVMELDKEALLAFMEEHPGLGYKIIQAMARSLVSRLRATNQKIFALYAWGLKNHQAEF